MMEKVFRLLLEAGRLKRIPRKGWALKGVANAESVADHSFRVSLMVMLFGKLEHQAIDLHKSLKMAVIHDLAECIVGDITPHDKISCDEKLRRGRSAIDQLVESLGDTEVRDLWEEFEAGQTREAVLVRELDFVETLLQALEYEKEDQLPKTRLQEFWDAADSYAFSDFGKRMLQWLKDQRSGTE